MSHKIDQHEPQTRARERVHSFGQCVGVSRDVETQRALRSRRSHSCPTRFFLAAFSPDLSNSLANVGCHEGQRWFAGSSESFGRPACSAGGVGSSRMALLVRPLRRMSARTRPRAQPIRLRHLGKPSGVEQKNKRHEHFVFCLHVARARVALWPASQHTLYMARNTTIASHDATGV